MSDLIDDIAHSKTVQAMVLSHSQINIQGMSLRQTECAS